MAALTSALKQYVCGVYVSNLLGEALLGLDLVVLLCRHPGDAAASRPWQCLHLFDGFHGNTLGKHLEEWRHVHDDTLLVRVRHCHIWRTEMDRNKVGSKFKEKIISCSPRQQIKDLSWGRYFNERYMITTYKGSKMLQGDAVDCLSPAKTNVFIFHFSLCSWITVGQSLGCFLFPMASVCVSVSLCALDLTAKLSPSKLFQKVEGEI